MATSSQQAQSAHTPSSDHHASDQDVLWDGDKMFNIYIWDYCTKRGYSNTARELADEAKLSPNPRPPIDAKQGLLYEWWSVFWVLFSAKSNNSGSDDAMLYIQHHMQQQRMQAPMSSRGLPNGVRPNMPGGAPITGMSSVGGSIPPPGGGPTPPSSGPSAHPPPPMPNGIHGPPSSALSQHQPPPHQPQQQPHQQPQGQPQPQPHQQPQGQQPQQPQQPQQLGPHPQQLQGQPQPPDPAHQQRGLMYRSGPLGFPGHQPVNGMQGQQGMRPMHAEPGAAPRMPMSGPPFQSPTMAHPHPPGGTGQHPLQPPQQGNGPPPPYPGPTLGGMPPTMYAQPQMHMRGMPSGAGMPNGVGVGMPVQGPGPGVASPGYIQNTGSRAATPAQGGMAGGLTNPSPNLANRQVPQTPPSFGGMSVPTGGGRGPPFDQMNTDIAKIDPQTMSELKAELGLGNKDPTAMGLDEKTRLLNTYRLRQQAGPSSQAGPNARNQQGRGSKRNSVSPPDEHQEIPAKGESSPPAQKRVRRSPESSAPPNAQGSAPPPQGPQTPMAGMYPPGMNNMMPPAIRSGPSFTPQMSHMAPGMMMQQGMVTAPQQMTQQFQSQKNNQQQYIMHKMGGDPQTFAPDVNQPRSAPPPFAPGGASNVGNRPGQQQNKPSGNMMPPPSSPATNGVGKPPPPQQQQGAQGKSDGAVKTENSPRSGSQQQPPSASAGAPSPATSTSGQAGGGGAGAPSRPSTAASTAPATTTTPTVSAGAASAVSVSASGAPTSGVPADSLGANFDFIGTGFDDFTSMFGREEDINFESDFGAWFGSDLLDSGK